MTALAPDPLSSLAPVGVVASPIALLQLDGSQVAAAASEVYSQSRRGRRVVAVVAGDEAAPTRLAKALDAIGVAAACPDDDSHVVFDAPVALLRGPGAARPAIPSAASPRLRVALAGCGVVGGGLLARLRGDPRSDVVGVLVRRPDKPRDVDLPSSLAVTDPAALLAREPDVVIDCLSDASTGLALLRATLARGVHAIGAGKQAIGTDLPGLLSLAHGEGASLRYSACVGGGAPMIETVRRARSLGAVRRIEGVLNGTCNYVLDRMGKGAGFDQALAEARAAGFAEADASADLSGLDAAAKLSILAHEAGGVAPVSAVRRQPLAGSPGPGVWRQVSRFDLASGEATVSIEPATPGAWAGSLPDEWNALRVELADGRILTARGRGAGRAPTVESVWADLADLRSAWRCNPTT